MILVGASPLSLVLAGTTIVVYGVLAVGTAGVRRWVIWTACGLHGTLLAMGLLGPEPRFGFAPALSVTAWLVALVYALEGHFYPQLQTPGLVSWAGALTVVTAWYRLAIS